MQMDLMFFVPKIKGQTGVLNVIDVHSRKAFSELIRNKKEATVLVAFRKILAEIENRPRGGRRRGGPRAPIGHAAAAAVQGLKHLACVAAESPQSSGCALSIRMRTHKQLHCTTRLPLTRLPLTRLPLSRLVWRMTAFAPAVYDATRPYFACGSLPSSWGWARLPR